MNHPRAFMAAAVLLLLLGGCAQPVQVSPQTSALLPRSAAIDILQRTFSREWVEQPWVSRTEFCSAPFSRVPIAFTDIKAVKYFPALGQINVYRQPPVVFSCVEYVRVPVDRQAVEEVMTALRSLGACSAPGSEC